MKRLAKQPLKRPISNFSAFLAHNQHLILQQINICLPLVGRLPTSNEDQIQMSWRIIGSSCHLEEPPENRLTTWFTCSLSLSPGFSRTYSRLYPRHASWKKPPGTGTWSLFILYAVCNSTVNSPYTSATFPITDLSSSPWRWTNVSPLSPDTPRVFRDLLTRIIAKGERHQRGIPDLTLAYLCSSCSSCVIEK